MQTVISNSVSGIPLNICLMTRTSKPNICVYLSYVLIFQAPFLLLNFLRWTPLHPQCLFKVTRPGWSWEFTGEKALLFFEHLLPSQADICCDSYSFPVPDLISWLNLLCHRKHPPALWFLYFQPEGAFKIYAILYHISL